MWDSTHKETPPDVVERPQLRQSARLDRRVGAGLTAQGVLVLLQARNAVDQAWSHIEVELKRRLDLIQNLVEIAKGYAKYERDQLRRFNATCKMKIEGKMPKFKVRWELNRPWGDSENVWIGSVRECKISDA